MSANVVTFRRLGARRRERGRLVSADAVAALVVSNKAGFRTVLRSDIECRWMPCGSETCLRDGPPDCPMREA